ncbi:MAG: AAA family ATPase [Deltaproteobacteria bacterium]|nr:AAA family ATPase [Deltaproteobacteria bacterium]
MYIKNIAIHSERFPAQDDYPFNLEIFEKTKNIALTRPVTFFIGENGTGKSTLLQAVAKRCGIHIWRDDEGYIRRVQHRSPYAEQLYRYIQVEWSGERVKGSYFDAEIFRYFAECLDAWAKPNPALFQYYGGESLVSRSHGQRHIQYFGATYCKKGLYFLDEPENALSPRKQIDLLKILKTAAETGQVQFLAVTHSPILLSLPEATIFSFDEIPVKETAYEDTDYFRLYKDFLNDRDKYLRAL